MQSTMNDPTAMNQPIQGNKAGDNPQAQAMAQMMKQAISPQMPMGPAGPNDNDEDNQNKNSALSGMMARYGG